MSKPPRRSTDTSAGLIPFDRTPRPTLDEVEVLTIKEASQFLRISLSQMYVLLAQGAIPHLKVGSRIKRIRKTAMLDYIKAQEARGR